MGSFSACSTATPGAPGATCGICLGHPPVRTRLLAEMASTQMRPLVSIASRRRGESPYASSPVTHRMGIPCSQVCSSIAIACSGLVAKRTSAGTRAWARRCWSPAHAAGRDSWRSRNTCAPLAASLSMVATCPFSTFPAAHSAVPPRRNACLSSRHWFHRPRRSLRRLQTSRSHTAGADRRRHPHPSARYCCARASASIQQRFIA